MDKRTRTEEMIMFIQCPANHQKDVANEYAKLLIAFDIEIALINRAIIERWSRSGLIKVKTMAWKIAERKLG